MLLISFACILMALARLRAIVLGPIGELVGRCTSLPKSRT